MLPQFSVKDNYRLNYYNLSKGLYLLAIGLAKKVILAGSIATFVNVGFDTMTSLTMVEVWITSLSYTIQLYFDFSGYCDIAMGLGLILTFNVVNILWVFFRATTINSAVKFISAMFNFKAMFLMLSAQFRISTVTTFGNPVTALFLLISIGISFLFKNTYEKEDFKLTLFIMLKTAVLLGLSIMFLGDNSAFLYFNF